MTVLEKHRLEAKLHEEVLNAIAFCVGDGDEETIQFALKYAIRFLTKELFYRNKKENENDYLR